MIERLGSDYGGWWCDPDLVSPGDFVIDAGVGLDVSFAKELINRRDVRVVGIDPGYYALRFVAEQALPNYLFVLGAVSPNGSGVTMYRDLGSESCYPDHEQMRPIVEAHKVPGVSIVELVKELEPKLVKMDIEGAEYGVYRQCFGVKQVLIEFHHGRVRRFTEKDTNSAVKEFLDYGYKILHQEDRSYTFLL